MRREVGSSHSPPPHPHNPGCVTMSQSHSLSGPQFYHFILSYGQFGQFILLGWGAKKKRKTDIQEFQ